MLFIYSYFIDGFITRTNLATTHSFLVAYYTSVSRPSVELRVQLFRAVGGFYEHRARYFVVTVICKF